MGCLQAEDRSQPYSSVIGLFVHHSKFSRRCRRWVNNCRAILRNARLFYLTKLPRRPFAIEAVTSQTAEK
jgi:hypothetical protein